MTEPLTMDDINKLHKEKFGVAPVITGRTFWDSDNPIEKRVLEAIENNTPYKEEPVEKTVDV